MSGFRDIAATDFATYSLSEIRAMARAISGDGIAADAAAIAESGQSHAASLAELSRDASLLTSRWSGDAAWASFSRVRQYVTSSYWTSADAASAAGQVASVAGAATATHTRFAEVRSGPDTSAFALEAGAAIGGELRTTYTTPVQSDAGTMPLAVQGPRANFEMRPGATGKGSEPPGTVAPPPTVGDGGGGDGAGGEAPSNPGDGPVATDESPTTRATDDQGRQTVGQTDPTATTGTRQPTGTGSPTASTTSSADPGLDTQAQADPTRSTDSDDAAAADSPIASLLTPATSVPGSPTSRVSAPSLSGVRSPTSTSATVASPLGLRQDTTALRAGAPSSVPTGTPTGTGARPSSSPYGMPPGAGAQRGSGDGRHRVPAYLIDRANGEELVGEMPLVGPGVIGQWRPDGAPDLRRPPDVPPPASPPATSGPRRR